MIGIDACELVWLPLELPPSPGFIVRWQRGCLVLLAALPCRAMAWLAGHALDMLGMTLHSKPRGALGKLGVRRTCWGGLVPNMRMLRQVLEMLEKGETPPNIRTDIVDEPPDPAAVPSSARMQPRAKPWERSGAPAASSAFPTILPGASGGELPARLLPRTAHLAVVYFITLMPAAKHP